MNILKRSLHPLKRRGFVAAMLARFWGRSASLTNQVALALIILGTISGIATYGALTASAPFGENPRLVMWLLNVNLIILLLLITIIARRIVGLWVGRKRGAAGARLHVRLVFIFSVLAAAPAIIMTVFSAFFLNFAIESWFNDRVGGAVNNAQAVAEAYLDEHRQVIRADAMAMATDLDREANFLVVNPQALESYMRTQSMIRNFSEAIIFDQDGTILGQTGFSLSFGLENVSPYNLMQASRGEVVIVADDSDDRVRALVPLKNFKDGFLLVGRMVDPVVIGHLSKTREAVSAYKMLEGQRSGLQLTFTMIFIVVALMLLLGAIWFGLVVARQMITPISALISTTERVRGGDLMARVPAFKRRDEFDLLGRAFNRMTSQIQEQRDELINANRQLDHRRRFTETVLAGVSSGILGLDEAGIITIANSSASGLFQLEADILVGQSVTSLIPDLDALLKQAHENPDKVTQAELSLIMPDETKRVLLVRIAIEVIGEQDKGAVLTFDDITELQSAQRKAAWADVARRIAHEIKNPLTPIQLSAERLRRKYLSEIKSDPDTFSKCTDTIIHHVGDIGRMVNEFSAFARMPEPIMKKENVTKHLRDMLVLQQQAHGEIDFNFVGIDGKNDPIFCYVDAQQLRQAVTNLIQNALDSVQARVKRDEKNGGSAEKGVIDMMLIDKSNDEISITVTDNGLGLPKNEDPTSLTEPYVTHRAKGTGLGLAIVKKIMEDHQGQIVIGTPEWLKAEARWHDRGGASVSLVLPRYAQQDQKTTIIEGNTNNKKTAS